MARRSARRGRTADPAPCSGRTLPRGSRPDGAVDADVSRRAGPVGWLGIEWRHGGNRRWASMTAEAPMSTDRPLGLSTRCVHAGDVCDVNGALHAPRYSHRARLSCWPTICRDSASRRSSCRRPGPIAQPPSSPSTRASSTSRRRPTRCSTSSTSPRSHAPPMRRVRWSSSTARLRARSTNSRAPRRGSGRPQRDQVPRWPQ